MHNQDKKRKLEEKDDIGYYSKNKLFQSYVQEIKQGLDFVSKLYKKLIILFHTSSKTRLITIFFLVYSFFLCILEKEHMMNLLVIFFNKNVFYNNPDKRINKKIIKKS
jgi:hypothetical protein